MLLIYFMKRFILFMALVACMHAYGQNPDDAIRTAWFTQNGTARNMATGGVMGSLGGDITAAHVNPAGLGLYKTSEFVVTAGFLSPMNKLNFSCLLYTSPSPRDRQKSRMPSSA